MNEGAPDRMIGRTLGGRYRVEGRIARGGMATVYYAIDARLDRPVALKVLLPSLSADPDIVARFMAEARAAAGLSHPNVVAVYDQGMDGDVAYLAMEYVEGRTLRDVLREHGPLTPRQAFAVLEPMLAALAAAHQAGLVHRDVKPENVLVADDGSVKVADFGLARAADAPSSQTVAGMLMGTVAYISPEQVDGGVADARSDVYAAGIVLFELLTGAKPYAGDSTLHIAYQHANSDVPAPSVLVRGLVPLVDGLVSFATHRDPGQRPADADRYLAEVRRVSEQLSDAELDAGGTPRVSSLASASARSGVSRPAAAILTPAEDDTAILPRARGNSMSALSLGGGSGIMPRDSETTRQVSQRMVRRRERSGSAPPARSRRRGGLAMTFLLAAALVVGLFAWWLGGGGHANVPAVVGMTQAEAIAVARDAGLRVQVGPAVFSDEVAPGLIAGSDPPPGTRVNRGVNLILYPSRGPELFAVPNLAGKTVTEAESMLAVANLRLGEVTEQYDRQAAEGIILATQPKAGTDVTRDTAVTVIVSGGPRPVDVPNVVGERVEDARAILDAAGFQIKEQTAPSEAPAGIVIAQNPAEGSAPAGSTVEMTVASGPELIQVPNAVGMTVDQARGLLEGAGFAVEVIEVQLPGRRDRDGIVAQQDPAAGAEAPRDSTVQIWAVKTVQS